MSDNDDDRPGDTGRRRRISESDAEEIARATQRAQESMLRRGEVQGMKMQLVEAFGIDGKGGRFKAVEEDVRDHGERLVVLEAFKIRAMAYGTAVAAIGGALAALAGHLIGRLF